MGMFDNLGNIKDQVLKAAAEHPDVVEKVSDEAIERVGDVIDQVTGDKFSGQVDQAQAFADERVAE